MIHSTAIVESGARLGAAGAEVKALPLHHWRAVTLGGVFLWYAWRMKVSDEPSLPMRTFSWSITYLMALFAFLLVDHYIPPMLRLLG